MARTTRLTLPEGALVSKRGVGGPAPAGVRVEASEVREAPERGNLVGGRSIASDRLPLARPGRLRTGAEGTSLETSPGAFEAAPPTETIELDCLDGDLLRRRWRSVIGRHPPKTLSPALMVRILTWREQVLEVRDVSPRSRAILAAAIRGKDTRAETGGEPELGPIAHAARPRMPIRAGTVLVREHVGVLHRVTVAADGFEWDGRTFGSLSAVARAITGVSWSGRRFFGLDRGPRQAGERSSPGKPNGTSRAGGPP